MLPPTWSAPTPARVSLSYPGRTPELFAVLFGQALWHTLRGQYQAAQELAEQLLRMAQQRHDLVSLVEAHAVLGTVLVTRGALEAGCTHLEAGSPSTVLNSTAPMSTATARTLPSAACTF